MTASGERPTDDLSLYSAAEVYTQLPAVRLQHGDMARMSWWLKGARFVIRGIFQILFSVRVSGIENMPTGPVIIVANHLGWADPFLALLYFPPEPRIYILGDHHAVVSTGLREKLIDMLGLVVPLDPHKPRPALLGLRGILQKGGRVLLFPEGAPFAAVEGKVRPLHDGAAYLSVLTGVPVLPVGISGTLELWLRGKLRMRAGRLIEPSDFGGDRRERVSAISSAIYTAIDKLVPPLPAQRGPRLLKKWLTNLFA